MTNQELGKKLAFAETKSVFGLINNSKTAKNK